MAAISAGIVLWRHGPAGELQVLLGHMGGPFWARKDDGAWSIPKGLVDDGEDPIDAARREFVEELGVDLPAGELVPLGEIRQSSSKVVVAWALQGDVDVDAIAPGTFEMEWPRGSGRTQEFPEIDRAEWFDLATAKQKCVRAQAELLDRLT